MVAALQIIEPKLKDLSVYRREILGDVGLKEKLPIALLGEGMHALLSMVLAIINLKDGIVLIDEIENGLYYRTLPSIWKCLQKLSKQYKTQIFATTHSREMIGCALEGIGEEQADEFRFIHLGYKDNQVKSQTYNYSETQMAIKNNLAIR